MSQMPEDAVARAGTVELRHALEETLGRPCSIALLERRPSAYHSTWALEELDVYLDDGTRLELMFKDLSRQAQLASARRAKPTFLYDPLREIDAYQKRLAPRGLGTANLYGAVVDADTGRYWLFLERVPGTRLSEVGEFAVWRRVAVWLANLHHHDSAAAPGESQATHFLRYDADFYRLWLRRAQAFARPDARTLPPGGRGRIDRLARHYERVVERLSALPTTFIHGEFYASNVIVQERGTDLRVCPIDWEMAALGPGLVDLAALTGGAWSVAEREELALAYWTELTKSRGASMTPETFLETLAYCHLHLAIQWLGWSADWKPPPEHRYNWLGEALELAERLGL
jgi:hypothetical protein